MRTLTKQEIKNHLSGTLAMTDGFNDLGHAGGARREDMQKYLPHQIATRIMALQVLIENCELLGDTSLAKTDTEKRYTPEEAYDEITRYSCFSGTRGGDRIIDKISETELKKILKQIK